MDIDDNNTENGLNNQGTVSNLRSSILLSTNEISNGHFPVDDNSNNQVVDHNKNSNECSAKSTEVLDDMECDGYAGSTRTMDTETTMSSDVQKKSTTKEDDQLLVSILQFGRELHTLKQQLAAEHGDNLQNDKMLQVNCKKKG